MGWAARANPTAQTAATGELKPRVKEQSDAVKADAARAIRLALGGLLSLRDRNKRDDDRRRAAQAPAVQA